MNNIETFLNVCFIFMLFVCYDLYPRLGFGQSIKLLNRIIELIFYPPTKSEGYSFGVVRPSIPSVRPSVHTFCLSPTISQYLSIRFDLFLVQMKSTMDSRYPISLVKIDPLTLELLPLF